MEHLPSGTFELVISLEDGIRVRSAGLDDWRELVGAVFSGAYSQCFAAAPRADAALLGILFRPGGAFPFLGMPASELADAHVEGTTLWGSSASELRERLLEVSAPDERFDLVEEALLRRLCRKPERHRAVLGALRAIESAEEEVRIRDLAEELGLCQRRLIEVFSAEVGLTPKRYQQIRRFQRVCSQVRNADDPDWAAVAAEGGYFDQSHLIHEFRRFSGFTPVEFLRQSRADPLPNRVYNF
jgi:AraC-like DNA-binding protein